MAAATAAVVSAQRKKRALEPTGRARRLSFTFQEGYQEAQRACPKLPQQDKMYRLYNHQSCQLFVAGLIIVNFLTTIAEKEIDPPFGESYLEVWQWLEDIFNIVFLLELILNFWGSFFFEFWKSGWNIFDFIVVSVGTLGLLRVDLPPELSLLRTLRAFRVFRLFKRVESLNKIIKSIIRALPPVSHALMIMLIVMMIYAIIAVEWFAEFGSTGSYTTYYLYTNQTNAIGSITGRGLLFGEEYYGTFSRSLYTLWQVLTGESWSEAIVRPLLFGYETPGRFSGLKVSLFFVSFLVIMQIILVNVVVAILLEKMVDDSEEDDDQLAPESGTSELPELERSGTTEGGQLQSDEMIDARSNKSPEDNAMLSPANCQSAVEGESPSGGSNSLGEPRQPSKSDGCHDDERILLQIVSLQDSVASLHQRLDRLGNLDARMSSMHSMLEQLVAQTKTAL